MLDLNNEGDLKAYEELKDAGLKMSGCNFALAIRRDDGIVRVFQRPNQPCQGGEMRKYEKTHPGDCTRPKDPRPGDLTMPFPDGTPEAVSVHFNMVRPHADDTIPVSYYGATIKPGWTEFLTALYGPNSPYIKGFGSPENVELLYEGDHPHGILFKDTSFDPTVFVNSLQFLNTMKAVYPVYMKYRNAGFTEAESLLFMMLCNSDVEDGYVMGTYPYYFPVNASFRRILEGKPHDLSGGTFRDRFDYNRPQVQSLFAAGKNEHGVTLKRELEAKGLVTSEQVVKTGYNGKCYTTAVNKKVPFPEFCAAARIVIDEALEASKDEDLSQVTLVNKDFGKSGAPLRPNNYGDEIIEEDYSDEEGYDEEGYDENYDDDGNTDKPDNVPADGNLKKSVWYNFKGKSFLFGCPCYNCEKNEAVYKASLTQKIVIVETNTPLNILYPTVATSDEPIVPKTMKAFVKEMKAAPKAATAAQKKGKKA